jgi:phosphoenolpyruvate synthase/pyruvate phosphate dikinase
MKMSEILEAPQSKITAMKPGVSAEIDHGDGTKTTVDLKKNPAALDKDETGKVKLNKKPNPGATKDPKKVIKPGDQVEVD